MQLAGERPDAKDGSDDGALSEDMIIKLLDAVRSRITLWEHRRGEIDRVIATAKEEERLLVRLLDLRRGGRAHIEARTTNEEVEASPLNAAAERRHPAVLAVIDELAMAGRPVHISELMRLLGLRRVAIPGLGTQANLIAHLRRDPRLVRPSRGMYALDGWGLENMMPSQRKSRKKRSRVTGTKQ